MSDLVDRLRTVTGGKLHSTNTSNAMRIAAADRIEQLEWELNQERNASNKLVESLYAFNKNSSAILSWYYMRNKVKVSK